ncbi:hypothetical protein BDW71DRAFT_64061 [Aspergillus fruticulosus]
MTFTGSQSLRSKLCGYRLRGALERSHGEGRRRDIKVQGTLKFTVCPSTSGSIEYSLPKLSDRQRVLKTHCRAAASRIDNDKVAIAHLGCGPVDDRVQIVFGGGIARMRSHAGVLFTCFLKHIHVAPEEMDLAGAIRAGHNEADTWMFSSITWS